MFEASESIQWMPLHAEAREKYSYWYKPELNPGCEGRAKFLYEQLKARPSPWGKGLWKDEETEKIAEKLPLLVPSGAGRGDGVQGVLYHLVLMGFSAGFLWYVMGYTPVDKIVALLR